MSRADQSHHSSGFRPLVRRSSSPLLFQDYFTSKSNINNNNSNHDETTLPIVGVFVMGCWVFSSSLAISTWLQGKVLGISTGSLRPIPSLVGMATVCAASLATHCVSSSMIPNSQGSGRRQNFSGTYAYSPHQLSSTSSCWESVRDYIVSHKNAVGICALGLVSFQLLGGRFWAIAPSSYTHVGSFARASIAATERYATAAQRLALTKIGRRCGCHTCGTRIAFGKSLIADHQPPKSVVRQRLQSSSFVSFLFRRNPEPKFRFFPQCVDCSQIQGSILSAATRQSSSESILRPISLAGSGGGRMAYYHGLKFRWNHLTGGIISGTALIKANDWNGGNLEATQFLKRLHRHYVTIIERPIDTVMKRVP